MTFTSRLLVVIATLLALCACGGGGGAAGTGSGTVTTPPPTTPSSDIALLFMGNSHSSVNGLPAMVASLVRAVRPGQTVTAVEAPGWMFLEERSVDAASLALLRSRAWSAVILQAQKYSTSGQFTYPITGAVALVHEARTSGALPILFPEWPLRGVDETQRIYDLHVSIAQQAPACVAPIGQAWDRAMQRHPQIVLYAADGNHSAPAGAFLAALVLAATYTQTDPSFFPALEGIGVDASTQAQLRVVARDTVNAVNPRQWCPAG